MPFRTTISEGEYASAAMMLMRLAGLGVAFQERWMELQITTAIHVAREWAQLMSSAQHAAEEILGDALSHAGGAEPLTGRRRVPSRRRRSVVINFPERRAPGEPT